MPMAGGKTKKRVGRGVGEIRKRPTGGSNHGRYKKFLVGEKSRGRSGFRGKRGGVGWRPKNEVIGKKKADK